MATIDRTSIEDAQKQIGTFIPSKPTREAFFHFLADMILYAHSIDRGNWNLNLDKAGRFLQFNTGQEYCLTISTEGTFLVCLKEPLRQIIAENVFDIEFRGYLSKKRKTSRRLEEVPDCLAKVPGSVGCLIQHEYVIAYIPYFQHPVQQFIDVAMRETTILPKMKNAHSSGSIAYVSRITQRYIPNPYYIIEDIAFQASQEKLALRARSMTDDELRKVITRQQQ